MVWCPCPSFTGLLPAPAVLKSRPRTFSKVLPPMSLCGLYLWRSVSRRMLQPIPILRMAFGIVLSAMGTCCSARRRIAAYRCPHPLGGKYLSYGTPQLRPDRSCGGTTAPSSWLCHRCRPWAGPSAWPSGPPHHPPGTPCAVWRGPTLGLSRKMPWCRGSSRRSRLLPAHRPASIQRCTRPVFRPSAAIRPLRKHRTCGAIVSQRQRGVRAVAAAEYPHSFSKSSATALQAATSYLPLRSEYIKKLPISRVREMGSGSLANAQGPFLALAERAARPPAYPSFRTAPSSRRQPGWCR